MNARSAVIEMSADKLDDAVKMFRDDLIPRYREQSGYKGFTLLVNRESGKAFGVSFWDSEDDLKASDDLGAEAREGLADTGGGSAQARETWEVAVDDEV